MQGRYNIRDKVKKKEHIRLTFTFKALFDKTPQQTTTMVTECGALVVIALEAMRHINLEALFLELRTQKSIKPTENSHLIIKNATNGTVCCQY